MMSALISNNFVSLIQFYDAGIKSVYIHIINVIIIRFQQVIQVITQRLLITLHWFKSSIRYLTENKTGF